MFGKQPTADEFYELDGSIGNGNIVLGVPHRAIFENKNLEMISQL